MSRLFKNDEPTTAEIEAATLAAWEVVKLKYTSVRIADRALGQQAYMLFQFGYLAGVVDGARDTVERIQEAK
jgi:hypothetical protein